jgi:polyketide synthase PksL
VVESYRPEQAADDAAALQAPCHLLVLSARTEAALAARIEQLIAVLEQSDSPSLLAMSHTLLCGRQHFQHRCAIVAEDRESALYGLKQAVRRERLPNLFQGTVVRHFSGQKTLELYGNELLTRCDSLRNDPAKYQETLCALADLYCQGYQLDWQNLHASATPRRISLPTYPFATDRYWIEAVNEIATTNDFLPARKGNGFDELAYQKLLDKVAGNSLNIADAVNEAAKLLS